MTTAFIEKQFPVSKLSKESYKERKANNGQTLTGLGKWWGRKPLVLVRAAILGCLMPASDKPKRDMEIFLKIMSMDDSGLWQRNTKRNIGEREFGKLGYDEKLKTCLRPEQFVRPADDHAWNEINHHLGTHAYTLQDLMRQLSEKRFGKNAVIGDCFCGGGSVPFEAARMGLDVYASDLNPVAGLLTWAAIHICGASDAEIAAIKDFQRKVYDAVDCEITELGIEHDEKGDRAVSYIYCVEARCPECGVLVPMAPSWVIGKGTKTVAKLRKSGERYDIAVIMDATDAEMKAAENGTVTSKGLLCPNCGKTTPISVLRRDRKDENGEAAYGLRPWEKNEFEPRPDDVYQERLYCIKYERPVNGRSRAERYYRAPNGRDLANEEKVRHIVAENIAAWQEQGLVPSMMIESGYNTDQVIRERGWTHWNHLFNARQLLLLSKFIKYIESTSKDTLLKAVGVLGLHKCIDWNSRLCRWNPGIGNEKSEQTYYNQALNSMVNWGTRSLNGAETSWFYDIKRV